MQIGHTSTFGQYRLTCELVCVRTKATIACRIAKDASQQSMAEGLNGLIFVKIVFTMVYLERKIIDSTKTSVLKEPV